LAFWTFSSGGVTQKTETLGGIRFVHNEGVGRWGATHPVGLDLVRTIGGLEESDPDLAFNDPYDIDVDSSGNIYVLDTANNRIQKLGPDGRFLKSIGRAGQGPGDLQAAFSIDIDPEDLLYVSEARNSRLQIFNTSGKPVGQIKYKSSDIFLIRKLPSGLIVRGGGRSLRALLENPKRLPPLLEILEPNGKVKKAFGEATDYQDALVNWMANATEFDTDRQGNIILGFKHQNRIDKYSPDGEMMWRADRPLNYGTEVIYKGSITRTRRGTVIQGPILNRVSMGIAADAEGRVWVNTFNRQLTPEETGETVSVNNAKQIIREGRIARMDINKLEVFGPDGGLLGEIPLSHLAHGIRIVGNTLFVWERENAIIYQYGIVDK
jgi:sugar lactone lactonase YvrE